MGGQMKNLEKDGNQLIQFLSDNDFVALCPCCGEEIKLSKSGLFVQDEFTPEAENLFKLMQSGLRERAKGLVEERKNIKARAEKGAEAVNFGFIAERIAPVMKEFPFNNNDCRSLFDPIDYVIFDGLSKSDKVSRIIFSDVKTGNAKLQKNQKQIKSAVENKKVEIEFY
jgi:predicted Holliday junction resolvase-like endonuclease